LNARLGAIGEALERYSAATFPLPRRRRAEVAGSVLELEEFSLFSDEQRRDRAFPYSEAYGSERLYTNAFSVYDGHETWMPLGLVGLTSEPSAGMSSSSGLATSASQWLALLRAIQEVIERDALMVTWLHSVYGRQVSMADGYVDPVADRDGAVLCFDATPAYSPWPVAIVAGSLPLRGRPRISLGAACRETWAEAVEKAYLEWSQGIVFAGYYMASHAGTTFQNARAVKTFDDHAVYYTAHPNRWEQVALTKGQSGNRPPTHEQHKSVRDTLATGLESLKQLGVRLYYRDLTTVDLEQLGLWTIRVISPDLTSIHCQEAFPYIGGRTADVGWRYPYALGQRLRYPNPQPHPLG
jgi:ribosomal protein S12 methylthiotransferase accessory factor